MSILSDPAEQGAAPGAALDARFVRDSGRVVVAGSQAPARLSIEEFRPDGRKGVRTAAFISGYQGSPLAGHDRDVRAAAAAAADVEVVFTSGPNEGLAATAVTVSQLAANRPSARHDGIQSLITRPEGRQ